MKSSHIVWLIAYLKNAIVFMSITGIHHRQPSPLTAYLDSEFGSQPLFALTAQPPFSFPIDADSQLQTFLACIMSTCITCAMFQALVNIFQCTFHYMLHLPAEALPSTLLLCLDPVLAKICKQIHSSCFRRSEPVLWDSTMSKYSNADIRKQALMRITQKIEG